MSSKKRTSVSTTQRSVETMSFNDWDLTFTYETLGEEKPNQINVNGQLKNSQTFVSFMKTATQFSVNFNNGKYDGELVAAVVTEIEDLMPSK